MPIVFGTSLTTNYISFFNTGVCYVKINEDGSTKFAFPVFAGGFPVFVRFWRVFAKFVPAFFFFWALTYIKKAEQLTFRVREVYQITQL
jgi:hypothetical protein